MNKLPSAKAIARFVVLTTPAIALVLSGIQQIREPSPVMISYPAPGTSPETETMKYYLGQIALANELLCAGYGFQPLAKVVKIDSPNVAHTHDNHPFDRQIVFVTVPDNITEKSLDANLRAVARDSVANGMKSVVVSAYKSSKGVGSGADCIADLTFAPHGDWDKTDRFYDVDEYETVIRHVSSPTTRMCTWNATHCSPEYGFPRDRVRPADWEVRVR